VTRFCEGVHGPEKGPEGPARSAPGLWRSFVRRDSGRASMERDTPRKLMFILKKLLLYWPFSQAHARGCRCTRCQRDGKHLG
jgi:hypothetical protein